MRSTLLACAVASAAAKEIPEWASPDAKVDFSSLLASGWAQFRWDSWAGYGIILAVGVTLISWVAVGYIIWRELYAPPVPPEARSADAAAWLQHQCPGSEVGTISEVNIYPIKGCHQLQLQRGTVHVHGLEGDRVCMVVTAADANFYTQRENPKMALIHATPDETDPAALLLLAPGQPSLKVALRNDGEKRTASLWEDPVEVVDQGDDAAAWLTEFLGIECRLVMAHHETTRATSAKFAAGEL
jgi:hypothetical protein